MNRYLAVAKLTNAATATKFSYEATDPSDAVGIMLKRLGRTTTLDIEEFEIMMLLPNNCYQMIASKNKREDKFRSKVVLNVNKVNEALATENTYTPYQLEAA